MKIELKKFQFKKFYICSNVILHKSGTLDPVLAVENCDFFRNQKFAAFFMAKSRNLARVERIFSS